MPWSFLRALILATCALQTISAVADERLLFPGNSSEPTADTPRLEIAGQTSLDPSRPAARTTLAPREPESVFFDEPAPRSDARPTAATGETFRLRIGPYGWLPEMYGAATIRDRPAEVAVTTRDLFNLAEHNVHFLFASQMEAGFGPWSAFASGIYVYGGFEDSIRRFNFDGKFSMAIVDAAVAYDLGDLAAPNSLPPGMTVEALAGGRYWLLDGEVSVQGTGPLGLGATRGNNRAWVDPVVGGRLTLPVSPDALLRLRGDVGGFGWFSASQSTWNVEATWEHQCLQNVWMQFGYRILDVDYEKGSGRNRFAFDVQQRGPIAGMLLEF